MSGAKRQPCRVMLVDDHRALREGVRLLLEAEGDIVVVGEAGAGGRALELAHEVRPDVVLMDISLDGIDGIEATRRLHSTMPGVAVLMLSAHPEGHLVRAACEAGAAGYLLKRSGGRELRTAVRLVAAGQPFLSDDALAATCRAADRDSRVRAESPDALTPRESEVLQLIAAGSTTREIAGTLGLSPKTVETHRTNLMRKLDLHDVASLTRYAIRKGVLPS